MGVERRQKGEQKEAVRVERWWELQVTTGKLNVYTKLMGQERERGDIAVGDSGPL